MMAAAPCIVCSRELREVIEERGMTGTVNQPDGGVAFESYGHYGTTVFDPMDGTRLEVNVCDECLTEAAKKGRVLWFDRKKRDDTCMGFPWEGPLVNADGESHG